MFFATVCSILNYTMLLANKHAVILDSNSLEASWQNLCTFEVTRTGSDLAVGKGCGNNITVSSCVYVGMTRTRTLLGEGSLSDEQVFKSQDSVVSEKNSPQHSLP